MHININQFEHFIYSLPPPVPHHNPSQGEKVFDVLMTDGPSEKNKSKASRKGRKKSLEIVDIDESISDSELKSVNFSIDEDFSKDKQNYSSEIELENVVFTTIDEESSETQDFYDSPEIEFSVTEEITDEPFFCEQPYEEQFTIDLEQLEREQFSKKLFSNAKNIAVFTAMILVLIGIPLLFSLISFSHKSENLGHTKVSVSEANAMENIQFEKSRIRLGEGLEEGKGFDEVKTKAYDSMTKTNVSSRFETVDDLSFYLDSNMSSTLALEKTLVTQFRNNTITETDFLKEMKSTIEVTNNLNHLLTINKQTYMNEGKKSVYDRLSDDMDSLMLYGDTLIYGRKEVVK